MGIRTTRLVGSVCDELTPTTREGLTDRRPGATVGHGERWGEATGRWRWTVDLQPQCKGRPAGARSSAGHGQQVLREQWPAHPAGSHGRDHDGQLGLRRRENRFGHAEDVLLQQHVRRRRRLHPHDDVRGLLHSDPELQCLFGIRARFRRPPSPGAPPPFKKPKNCPLGRWSPRVPCPFR